MRIVKQLAFEIPRLNSSRRSDICFQPHSENMAAAVTVDTAAQIVVAQQHIELSDAAIEAIASASGELQCCMWDERPSIGNTFRTTAGGAVLASHVSKYYFRTRGHRQDIFSDPAVHGAAFGPLAHEQTTPWGILLLRRAPDNDRNECIARAKYKNGMFKDGFNLDGRSPMVLMPVPEPDKWTSDARARYVYGAATCWEAWVDAKREQPDNPQLTISETTGFTGCIDLRTQTPSQVRRWIVVEWNKHQKGSGFNIQQYVNWIREYKTGFKAYMEEMGWNNDSFGVGPASRDSRMWEWLTNTYKHTGDLHVHDINEYNHSATFVNQMKSQGMLDTWLSMLAERCDHQNPKLNVNVYMKIAHALEVYVRCKHAVELTQSRKNTLLLILLSFGLPLVDKPSEDFIWYKSEHALVPPRQFNTQVLFKPKPIAALQSADAPDKTTKPKPKIKAKARAKKSKNAAAGVAEDPAGDDAPADAAPELPATVPDAPPTMMKLLPMIGALVDEWLWQVTSRPNLKIDVNKIRTLLPKSETCWDLVYACWCQLDVVCQ